MKYYANPTRDTGPVMDARELGAIATPEQGERMRPGWDWCADNGCFGKGYPGDEGWLAWLSHYPAGQRAACRFATAPDVVGDAAATAARSRPLLSAIRARGYRAAYVAQNGATPASLPWDEFDVLFIGGVPECVPCGWTRPAADRETKRCPRCGERLTEWKLSPAAAELAAEARRLGRWVHMGRVNSRKRLRAAAAMGCDSADGTLLTYGSAFHLPRLLSWLAEVNHTRAALALAA